MVFVACNNEEDPINNIGAIVVTTFFFFLIFRRSRAAYSEVREGILPKFKLIEALMVGLVI